MKMDASTLWLALAAAAAIAALIHLSRTRQRPPKRLPAGVTVRYTAHATQRMGERGITAAQVEVVLADPARTRPDPAEHSVRLERDFTDRILKVWVAEPWPAKGAIVIKSTAWKYLATLTIPTRTVGRLIGARGSTIRAIQDQTGAHIKVDRQEGTVRISAGDRAAVDTARHRILAITTRPEPPVRGSRAA